MSVPRQKKKVVSGPEPKEVSEAVSGVDSTAPIGECFKLLSVYFVVIGGKE